MRGSITRWCFTLFMLLLLHDEGSGTAEKKTVGNVPFLHPLPKTIIPQSYEIKLVPEIVDGNLTHHGEVKIGLEVLEKTSKVTLHSEDLVIDENGTSLVDFNGFNRKPSIHTHVCNGDFLIIHFDQPITVGIYTLNLKFASNTNSSGISGTSRDDEDGEKVWTIFSKLTAQKRALFPCWDDPDLKATYNLSIKHSPNYTATSNMPICRSHLDSDGKQWTNFDVTPPLSTHQVAFVISNFECIRDENEMINFCGARKVLPSLKYARDVSEKALMFMEKHMDLKNNFSKIDLIAVPYNGRNDIWPSWGLIVYREPDVKYEPFVQPVSVKASLALTVVRGLVQQSFGNSVPTSADFWKYSSIFSGLTTYLKYYIVDKLYPDWKEMDKFRVDASTNLASKVYDIDEYIPLEWDSHEEAACHNFIPMTNDWGAVVFHMLSHVVNEDVFIAGITKFVNDNKYNNITADDLWDSIQSVYDLKMKARLGDLSIKEFVKPWTEHPNYPLLNVTRDYDTGKVTITQRSSGVNDNSSRWLVPINFATKSKRNFAITTPTHWLKPNEESLVIHGIDKDDWIIVNIQLSGFYRVDYDETNWKMIAGYLNSENYLKIDVLNRAQLLSDLYYMVGLNRQNMTTFFELARYLNREEDYIPWSQAMNIVFTLRSTIFDDEVDAEISNFFVKLMDKIIRKFGYEDRSGYNWEKKYKPFYDSLDNRTKKFVPVEKALEKFYKDGYKDEDFLTKRYRAKVLSFACALGHPTCLETAKYQFRANIENATENPISANLDSWVKCSGAAGNEDYLLKMVTGFTDTTYLSYLACSPDNTVLWKYVEGVLTGELKAGECQLYSALRGLLKNAYIPRNQTHLSRIVEFFMKNFDRIFNFYVKRLTEGNKKRHATLYTTPLLKDYIYHVSTLDELKKIDDMVRNISVGVPSVVEYMNQQTKRIEWSDKTSLIISEWINDNASPLPTPS